MASPLDPLKGLFSYPADARSDKDTRGLLAPSSRQLAKMRIKPVDGPNASLDTYELLLNPNSISESKSSNWVKHYVPGYDSPMLQWINGTERVISFTALVTKDLATTQTITRDTDVSQVLSFSLNSGSNTVDAYNAYPESEAKILKKMLDAASNTRLKNTLNTNLFTATPGSPEQTAAAFKHAELYDKIPPDTNMVKQLFPISIANNLDFYRSLLLPRISKAKSSVVNAPPLVILEMGTLLGAESVSSKMRFILLSYSINITKMTPQLVPIEAQVSFTFIEYTKTNRALKNPQPLQGTEGGHIVSNVVRPKTVVNTGTSVSTLPTNTATGGLPFTPTA